MEEYKRCPYCDELVRTNAIKCKHCGSLLTNSQFAPTGIITPETQVKLALSFKYEILEEIGRGGMASVYKATQKNLNRLVALKVIHQNLIYDNEFLQRFHQEAHLCASVNHPNIVTIYDEGAVNNIHYMAMEYLLGNDLQRIIRYNKKIVIEDAIKIIISIANALDHAHNKGLIHRDIKSGNIIITNEGRAVLTDFGIAFAANSSKLTQTGSVIGTPEYMSPEQAKGIKTDHRSDIYSLGVVLFECLTGKVPFAGDNPLTTIFKIINDKPPIARELNKEIPPWLSTVLNKTLEKDPSRRFQTGKEFALALINRKPVTVEILSRKKTPKKILTTKNYTKSTYSIFNRIDSKYNYLIIVIIIFAVFFISFPFINRKNHISIDPNTDTLNIKNNKVQLLLNTANNLFRIGNITYPENNNAYMLYKEVLSIEPGNEQASMGLENIRQSFVNRARNELEHVELEKTIIISDSALTLFPDDDNLLSIRSEAERDQKPISNIPSAKPKVEVPYLIGLSKDLAIETLRSKNLQIKISYIISEQQKNLVISQSPTNGTKLHPGEDVTLVIGE